MIAVAVGRCMCGEVKFKAKGKPKWVLWCHCQSCRRHTGAPASAYASFDDTSVEVLQGEMTYFCSSPGVLRGFCAKCGSTLTCSNARLPGETHYHLGAFEGEGWVPTGELYKADRLSWFLPRTGPWGSIKAWLAVLAHRRGK